MPQELAANNTNCLNCGTLIHEKYCSQCGQLTNTGEISFRETFSNFLAIAFALEGPLWLTIRGLIFNPGNLFREYIAGKRKTYYKPVAFFILITAIYLIFRSLIGFDLLEDGSAKKDIDELTAISPKIHEALKLMSSSINNVFFLLVFSIALMLKLFFKKRYNLAEYTSIALFIVGIYTIVRTITMFIDKYTEIEIDSVEFGILLLLIFYSSFSFFQEKNFLSIVKYILVSIFSLVLYIIFALVFFFLIVLLK